MRTSLNIILPNQLFEESSLLKNNDDFLLIEENLFFNQYKFHKQKILFHRLSMKFYQIYLESLGKKVKYLNSTDPFSDIIIFLEKNIALYSKIEIIDPDDNYIEKRIKRFSEKNKIELVIHENPTFLTKKYDLNQFFRRDKKKFFQTSFYKSQRKKLNILLNNDGTPVGGEWTYDTMNRERYPKDKTPPQIIPININQEVYNESLKYVEKEYSKNPGQIHSKFLYPVNFRDAKKWFSNFLETRFNEFGPYEDSIVKNESFLNHSLLSPLLNSGLLTPDFVVKQSLEFYYKKDIKINSCEGFIRQIIGWREFIRGIYYCKGSEERTKNFWGFKRKIPKSFYDGTTGIEPLDDSIKKILKTAYAHHIERLMIIGNFMLLCEFDPDEVYKWFMELFIDSYDWVMVPNVYGMSQFADGGIMSTKPYISGSNYILKMSDYKKGNWSEIWDSLFWNFIDKNRVFFNKNPRMRLLVISFDKMNYEKKDKFLSVANKYLNKLDISNNS
jgi:deoxyribodipyrimidine photolyase-related protein